MKHYFDLIPITAKVHKKQSRMVRTCIVLSVFLVTAIFGLAEMFMRSEEISTEKKDGAWHYRFQNISMEQGNLIAANPEVAFYSWYDVINYNIDQDYTINGKEICICGFNDQFDHLYPNAEVVEGNWPKSEKEIVLTKSAEEQLLLKVGDLIEIRLPDGTNREFRISGFTGNVSMLSASDAYGAFASLEGFASICKETDDDYALDKTGVFFVKYKENYNAKVITERIAGKLGLKGKQIQGNITLLALKGMSDDSYFLAIYKIGAILAILVSFAGILMITSNLNSNVESKTEFFGMLRCLGATKSQIIRYVRLEALNWCKSAIPEGVGLGIAAVWICSAGLKYAAPTYFSEMPLFGVSGISIAAGVVIGLMTVLLAAIRPAKRAATVSPVTAISGNAGEKNKNHKNRKIVFANQLPIDVRLGIHHATGSGKNFILMTLSFGFSIVLFLSFMTTVDFMHHAINPLKPYTPDITLGSADGTSQIPGEMQQKIAENPAVKKVYGRMFAANLPVEINGKRRNVDLISYEQNQFDWAKGFLLSGDIRECQEELELLSDYASSRDIATGDRIKFLNTEEEKTVRIGGVLSDTPFKETDGTGIIVCSESTFQYLMGEADYSIIDLQLKKGSSDQEVEEIRKMVGDRWRFSDQRLNNQEVRAAYYSFTIFVYGFLVIIGMISVFHILNSVAISVSSRMNQYGAMRAVGMTNVQILRMISAEAVIYAICGLIVGCLVGLPVHKNLYEGLVTDRWGTAWTFPISAMICIIVILIISIVLAVMLPYMRVKKLSIVDTINAL